VGAAQEDLASLFFKFDRRIRYVAVLDAFGKVIKGGMRPGVSSLDTKEESERVDMQIALIRGMAEGAAAYLGATNYVIVHREKIMMIALPQDGGNTILITTEPEFPIERVPALVEMLGTKG